MLALSERMMLGLGALGWVLVVVLFLAIGAESKRREQGWAEARRAHDEHVGAELQRIIDEEAPC